VFREPEQGFLLHLGRYDLALEDRRGVHRGLRRSLADVDGASDAVVRHQLANPFIVRHGELALAANLDFLRGVAVAVHHRAGGLPRLHMANLFHPLRVLEACNCLGLIEQISFG
jgi:hypothetical protein